MNFVPGVCPYVTLTTSKGNAFIQNLQPATVIFLKDIFFMHVKKKGWITEIKMSRRHVLLNTLHEILTFLKPKQSL